MTTINFDKIFTEVDEAIFAPNPEFTFKPDEIGGSQLAWCLEKALLLGREAINIAPNVNMFIGSAVHDRAESKIEAARNLRENYETELSTTTRVMIPVEGGYVRCSPDIKCIRDHVIIDLKTASDDLSGLLLEHYIDQLQLYMYATKWPAAMIYVINKKTGKRSHIDIVYDEGRAMRMLERAELYFALLPTDQHYDEGASLPLWECKYCDVKDSCPFFKRNTKPKVKLAVNKEDV